MAREPNKTETKKPETDTPLGPGTSDAPLVIKTNELLKDANVDPRGDNRPGVLPDQPLQEGIDPITNLREDLVDQETLTPKAVTSQPTGILNEPVLAQGGGEAGKKSSSRKVKMRAVSDIWPREKPAEWSDDDKANREYRIRAGEEVELPEDEAMDRMEAGSAVRADRRA